MRLPIQVVFRGARASAALAQLIRRRARKLEQWTPQLMSCHVVVERDGLRHRQGQTWRLTIRMRVPGDEFAVGAHHAGDDVHRVIGGAFDAADRLLEEHARRRRGEVKTHAPQAGPGETAGPEVDDAAAGVIRKQARRLGPPPQWQPGSAEGFRWSDVRAEFEGLPGGALNIGFEALDRPVHAGRGTQVALRWRAADGRRTEWRHDELRAAADRFAHALGRLGVKRGERLFVLLPRRPELFVAVLGALKAGVVVAPLFPAFGPEPVATRMRLGGAAAVVTTPALHARKVAPVRERVPTLRHVLLVDDGTAAMPATDGDQGLHDLEALLRAQPDRFDAVATQPDELALLHFTSGTTGQPKGVMHVHAAILTHLSSARFALDLRAGDVFWCTADPGWVTGLSYGVLAPLLIGATLVVDEGEFDAERWWRTLQDEAVTVWYTAPTAVRLLMRAGDALCRRFSFPALRFAASVGEPLHAEAVWWSQRVLGLPIHDNWWQTETGGIMIANGAAFDIRPGSMGRPLPGVEARLVERQPDGSLRVVDTPGVIGELALKRPWPSMFRGYLGEEARYEACFVGEWYLSGDLARRDADGAYWFVGRADDVIKSAGHRIGPFEVESVLMAHPAVAEAGVIGVPDELLGESVKAFVSLHAGFEPGPALERELMAHARRRLGPAVAPRSIVFAAELPRTRSGKILRRLLKARALGLPEGDLSTLEGAPS